MKKHMPDVILEALRNTLSYERWGEVASAFASATHEEMEAWLEALRGEVGVNAPDSLDILREQLREFELHARMREAGEVVFDPWFSTRVLAHLESATNSWSLLRFWMGKGYRVLLPTCLVLIAVLAGVNMALGTPDQSLLEAALCLPSLSLKSSIFNSVVVL